MSLILELSPTQEAQVVQFAQHAGLSVQDYAVRRLLLPEFSTPARVMGGEPRSLPPHAQVRALLLRWQQQDGTLTAPPAPNDGTMTPSEALFRQWEEEDAALTDEEQEAQSKLWEQFQEGIDTERTVRGMRRVF